MTGVKQTEDQCKIFTAFAQSVLQSAIACHMQLSDVKKNEIKDCDKAREATNKKLQSMYEASKKLRSTKTEIEQVKNSLIGLTKGSSGSAAYDNMQKKISQLEDV